MKITRTKLKQIIKEELEQSVEVEPTGPENIKVQLQSDRSLIKAIENLGKKIDQLDISIDFLAAAATGETAMSISAMQGQIGRGYSPSSFRGSSAGKEKVDEIIKQEVIAALKEISGERNQE